MSGFDQSAAGVTRVVAGTNVTVDATNPAAPIVSAPGATGGIVDTVVAGAGITVDATDPAHPIVAASGGSTTGASRIFGPFPVAFDSANITTTGVPLLTVPDGAIVLDVWIDGGADGVPWDAAATAQVNTPDLGFSAFYAAINLEGANYNGADLSGGFTVTGGAVLDALLVDAPATSTGYVRSRNVSSGPLDLVFIVTGAGPWTAGKAYVFVELALPPFPTVP